MLPIYKTIIGKDGTMSERLRSYEVARKTFSFLEIVGWSVVVLGIVAGFILAGSAGRYAGDGQKFLLFLLGASGSLLGLFMVGAVQNWRAGVDSAEYGQQALKVAREQLEISKRGLKSQGADAQSFSDISKIEELSKGSFAEQSKTENTTQMETSLAIPMKPETKQTKTTYLEKTDENGFQLLNESGTELQYRGRQFQLVDGKYDLNGQGFKSAKQLKSYLNNLKDLS